MKRFKLFLISVICAVMMTGCLTVEKKQYRVVMTGEKSGRCTIKFINIVSLKNNDVDLSYKDFTEFIDEYYKGKKLEKVYKGCKNFSKRLFVEKNQLCGEFSFDFDNLRDVSLFQYQNGCPYVLVVTSKEEGLTERLVGSNGERADEENPVVFFQTGQKVLEWETSVTEDMKDGVNLVSLYNEWQAQNK